MNLRITFSFFEGSGSNAQALRSKTAARKKHGKIVLEIGSPMSRMGHSFKQPRT